jgi:hypothetical protein
VIIFPSLDDFLVLREEEVIIESIPGRTGKIVLGHQGLTRIRMVFLGVIPGIIKFKRGDWFFGHFNLNVTFISKIEKAF